MRNINQENLIENKIRKIRDFVTQRRIQDKLMGNKPRYLQLCSCMDTVGDTQDAINAYVENIDKKAENKGELYLIVYGLLQSIFVQQDACIDMAATLSIDDHIRNYSELFNIRETRSQIIGHPTNYSHKRMHGNSYNTIIQHSLSRKSLEFISDNNPVGKTINEVNIEDIIAKQELYISEILDKILKEIKLRDDQHKKLFREVKLSSCFTAPNDVFYFCEKILNFLRHSDQEFSGLGEFGIEGVGRSLKNFSSMLEERGIKIETYPGIELVFNECDYPIKKIKEYIGSVTKKENPNMDKEAVIIFGEYLFDRLKELGGMAEEIDNEYLS
jgi:hypothetical protein